MLALPPAESAQRFVEDFHPNTLKYTTRTQLESIESQFYQPTVKYLGEFVDGAITALIHTSYPFAEPIVTLDQIQTYVNAWLQGIGTFETALQAAYEQEAAAAYQNAVALGMTAAGKELGFKIDLTVNSPAAMAFAKAESAKLVKGVWTTTKAKMGDIIHDGIAEGLSRDDVAKKLRKVKEDLPDWRSKLIAQTETTKALNGGQLLYYKEAGIKNKQWLDAQAGACPACSETHHQVVPIDKPFVTMFGDISAPPAHPGCRCSMNASFAVSEPEPAPPPEVAPPPKPVAKPKPVAEGEFSHPTSAEVSDVKERAEFKALKTTKTLDKTMDSYGQASAGAWKDDIAHNLGEMMHKELDHIPGMRQRILDMNVDRGNPMMYQNAARTPLEIATAPYKDWTNYTIAQWAGTSADSNAFALSAQKAVADEFGLPLGHLEKQFAPGHNHYGITGPRSDRLTNASAVYNEYGDIMRVFVRQQYNYTQQRLKEAGIKEITLFRGQTLPHAELRNLPSGYLNSVKLQPASSFSTSYQTSHSFSSGGGGGLPSMMATKIPASRVLGSFKTGWGCLHEEEYVVMPMNNGAVPAHVFFGKNPPSNQTMFTNQVKATMEMPHWSAEIL